MTEKTFHKKFIFCPTPTAIEIPFVKWQDREIPKTIYKYRNWDNKYHKRLITNLELYFPTPQEFNDPFDSQRNFDFEELLDPTVHTKYLEVFAKRLENNPFYDENKKKELIARAQSQKITTEEAVRMEQVVRENDAWINSLAGIFTGSLVNDSILLWSHYANSHNGFCVGLDTELLIKSIKNGGSTKEAKYEPKLVLTSMLIDIVDAIAEKTFTKYEAWGYEFEYRILAGQLRKNKVFPPPETFKEIIFGINMPKRDKYEIMYKAKKKISTIKFFEARKVRNEYRIEIVEL